MRLRNVWEFVAGESRLAPAGVAVAIVAALLLHRYLPSDGNAAAAFALVAILAVSLVAATFEKIERR